MVEPHVDDCLHRRRLGYLEHPGDRGGVGARRSHDRRALREQRHRQLSRPPPTQSGADPPDLYDRWVQLGTFEPILRLHSNNENRLPWQYPQPVQGITESFLRLREALLPYTYTLAAQTHRTGLPMAQPLYLDYPDQPSAYQNPTEYLYGQDMLVAPVTTPGNVASTTVWFPPGHWVDYFTGATFSGPSTATLSVPLNRMPVFSAAEGSSPNSPAQRRQAHRAP